MLRLAPAAAPGGVSEAGAAASPPTPPTVAATDGAIADVDTTSVVAALAVSGSTGAAGETAGAPSVPRTKMSQDEFDALVRQVMVEYEVRADVENGSHSKRSAALSSNNQTLSFGRVMNLSLVPTISKGERQTRQNEAHSSL